MRYLNLCVVGTQIHLIYYWIPYQIPFVNLIKQLQNYV